MAATLNLWLKHLCVSRALPDELIEESTGHAETDNEEILNARKTFDELNSKYKEEIKEEAEKVREAGGLYIIGTERHESRRIDNQLKGRAGRQGDPGVSKFFLSIRRRSYAFIRR